MAWCRQAEQKCSPRSILPYGVTYYRHELTHWGRVTHICVNKLTSIGSDNGLAPGRRQSIIWTNAGILLIRTLGTIFSEILIEIHIFPFTKMHLKMSSGKWRPICLDLNVLISMYTTCVHWRKRKQVVPSGQWPFRPTSMHLLDFPEGMKTFSLGLFKSI